MVAFAVKTPPTRSPHRSTVRISRAGRCSPRDVVDAHCADVGRDPATIRRSIHLMWAPDADPVELADRATEFGDAGVDLVIFSTRGPYEARLLEPLATALTSA